MTVLATWRSRRATRCRWTAEPTDFPTTRPIRGPALSVSSRQTWMTMSGWTARTPRLTVVPNSADLVMRYCVGSNVPPIRNRIRRSASRGPYGADRTQSPDRRGSASAVGSRARARVAGCSAGRSACPWPRRFLLIASGRRQPADRNTRVDTEAVGKLCVSLVTARHPGPCWNCCSVPGRGRIADVWATVRGYGPAFAGSNLHPAGLRRHPLPDGAQTAIRTVDQPTHRNLY